MEEELLNNCDSSEPHMCITWYWFSFKMSQVLPSKLLNDSNSSIRAVVLSCSWYLVATWTQICRFCRMLWVSMARRHSNESSTDREPK